jgi:hypothetical protein
MLEKVVPLEKNVYTPLRIYEKEDGTGRVGTRRGRTLDGRGLP